MLNGSDEIEACVKRKLGVELKEITPDGMFSAIEFECLGSCTTAPVMQINGEFYENLNAEKVERIIEDLRKR
jgi:NADH-quinone oxidoreductase subunit E